MLRFFLLLTCSSRPFCCFSYSFTCPAALATVNGGPEVTVTSELSSSRADGALQSEMECTFDSPVLWIPIITIPRMCMVMYGWYAAYNVRRLLVTFMTDLRWCILTLGTTVFLFLLVIPILYIGANSVGILVCYVVSACFALRCVYSVGR